MRSLSLAFTVLFLAACASNKEPPGGVQKPFPENKLAPAAIGESLKPAAATGEGAATGTKGSSITIRKSSLGKAFLLSMSLSNAAPAPRANALLPKVVTFEMNGSEVGLLEQNIYSIYGEIPNGKLLQSFPVESQDADTVTFKWSYGLASVPVKTFYVSADAPDSVTDQTTESETVYPVTASYLKYARVQNNRLELRQLSRVRGVELKKGENDGIDSTTKEETVQLDIAIAPYVPNPRFHPRVSTKLKGIGFFDIAQVRKDEGPFDIYSSHWDLSPEAGPITYAISKTAPAEAVDAMKEGLEYWNHVSQAALGRDIIKIETGADPDSPPRPRTVMIYWVPYANAGSAYANFSPDPLTGEIMSGFVYQTSVFYLSGRNRGRRFVNRGVENAPKAQLVATGFRPATICDYPEAATLGLDPLTADGMDEKIAQKMGLDYLRFVVAHETGHTLGLRHNFAGSLGSELATPLEAREKFREYLNDDHHQGAVTSSTVMDYITFRDVEMQAAAIGAKKVFPYDKAAITWAYGDKPVTPAELNTPYYCADSEGGALRVLGCATGDTGPHPLAGHAWELNRNRALLPDVVLEALTDNVRPDNPIDAMTVKQALAAAHPDALALTAGVDIPHIARIGGPGMKAIQIDRAQEGPNWANQREYTEQTKAFIAHEFELSGGLPGLLKVAYDLDDSFHARQGWLVQAVREKTAKAGFGAGKTMYGKPYQLSEGEIRDVKAAAEKLGDAAESAFLRDLLLGVTGLDPKATSGGAGKGNPDAWMAYTDKLKAYDGSVVQDSWAPGLDALASQLATDSGSEVEGTVDGKPVKVTAPRFTAEVRIAAMRLYSPKVFSRTADTWQKEASAKLAAAMIERLAPVVKVPDDGDPSKAVPAGAATPELQKWAKGELAVLKALWAARH